uniref:SCP domain-containing protein n=2 Tax=Clytia hemisphaerica TaxID=252671 RepID=A0A7M5XFW1_9CNID
VREQQSEEKQLVLKPNKHSSLNQNIIITTTCCHGNEKPSEKPTTTSTETTKTSPHKKPSPTFIVPSEEPTISSTTINIPMKSTTSSSTKLSQLLTTRSSTTNQPPSTTTTLPSSKTTTITASKMTKVPTSSPTKTTAATLSKNTPATTSPTISTTARETSKTTIRQISKTTHETHATFTTTTAPSVRFITPTTLHELKKLDQDKDDEEDDHHEILGKEKDEEEGEEENINHVEIKQKEFSKIIHKEKLRGFKRIMLDEAFCYYTHNYLRNLHGVPPLRWESRLAKGARQWAAHLAHNVHEMEHSRNENYRENIHEYDGSDETCGVLDALHSWYQTIKLFDYNNFIFDREKNYMSLMFMLMIWDDSTRIGCGVAEDKAAQKIFVVVRYAPTFFDKSPGNLRNHIKPPLDLICEKIDSSNITIPSIDDLATHIPPRYQKDIGQVKCSNHK